MAQVIPPTAAVAATPSSTLRGASPLLDAAAPGSPLMAFEPVVAEPNPPFVFPARSSLDSPSSSVMTTDGALSSPKSFGPSPATNRASVAQRRKANLLPSFDFHSPASDTPSTSDQANTPTSASPALPISGRGHRRGGSEFIGGDGKMDGPGLMSTSPTKGHNILPVPVSRTGPPAGRRGHAHRRSGAISCLDLSVILQPQTPTNNIRADSAPTSPAPNSHKEALPSWTMAQEQQGVEASPESVTESPRRKSSKEEKRPNTGSRPRVGFSDTLEFIPRPLSSLSSDTSSTVTTVRGHSASGSISSIASLTTPPRQSRSAHESIEEEQSNPVRPSTAETILSQESRSVFMLDDSSRLLKRPSSASALHSKLHSPQDSARPLNKKFSLPECGADSGEMLSAARYEPNNASSDTIVKAEAAATPKVGQVRKSPERTPDLSSNKVQKKGKHWAGSMFGRKSKPEKKQSKPQVPCAAEAPAEPLQDADMSSEFANFDSSYESVTPVQPQQENIQPSRLPSLDTGFVYQSPPTQPSESLSPIIDLDAALGPFNTPNLPQPAGRNFRSNGLRRQMHSSGSTGGFAGPGMHYHRRTESAPEMVAFDGARQGLHRFGSSSTMADVFEEDEEEEEEEEDDADRNSVKDSKAEGLGIGITVVDSDDGSTGGKMDWSLHEKQPRRSRPNSQISSEATPASTLWSASPSEPALTPNTETNPVCTVEILDEDQASNLRPASITKSSDSTITPPLLAEEQKPRTSAPESTLPPPSHRSYLIPQTPTSTTSSSFPSPDFPPSAFEHTRVITASSSFTDDPTFSSLLLGEPGPELRMSVDDVPSLTSSNSTMTSAVREPTAGHMSRGSGIYSVGSAGETRSATNITPAPRPRPVTHHGKRASLVSLSRLVGSSHGERSKLSIESRALPDSPEKQLKDRKPKRLSRMVDFFKPKRAHA